MPEPAADTEAAILDAARDEVLAHGVRRTTLSDIARRCGLSRQTIYRYWPDAQAIFAAVVTRELVAVLPTGGEDARTLDDLVDGIVATADAVRVMPILERLRTTDPELFARYILERLGTSQRVIHAELARRIAAGQKAGFVRPGEADRLAAMTLLIVQSAVQSAPLVAEWLDPGAWRTELTSALHSYLAPEPA
jgi:AcrR family transcriptional regulator